MARDDSRLLAALVFSGIAALGYELLWTRLLGLALGHEFLGVLAALSGFFGGLAIGAWLFHERVRAAKDPARLFVIFEIIAATYALGSPFLLHWLASWVPATLGPTIVDAGLGGMVGSLVVATLALLPATICMGATLPALVEARRRTRTQDPDGVGLSRLYGANTFGAVLGTVGAVHLVLPGLGLAGGAAMLALCGYAGAAAAWSWSKKHGGSPPADPNEEPAIDCSKDPDAEVIRERWLLYVLVFGTGLAGVGVEVVGVRVLSQVMSNTVYTFADVLAVYLLGTAGGAWAYQRHAARAVAGAPARVAAGLLLAQSLSVVVAATVLRFSPDLLATLAGADAGFTAKLLAEALTAFAVFVLPTVLMGALFSHLLGLLAARGIGRAYALNTLGSALAPFVFGLWALPRLGLTDAFFAAAWGYLALLVVFCWFRRFTTAWQIGSMLAVIGATIVGRGSLILVEPAEGWEVLERHEGVMGLVTVSEQSGPGPTGPGLRRLQVDRQFRMGGALSIGERRMGHIPLLLHGAPESVLYLGVGTGATAGASVDHAVRSVDAVELVPDVLETLQYFHDINGKLDENDRVSLHTGDARRWLAGSDGEWDVIVADLFHPERDGAGFLYSREHFEAVREHLAEGGLFAQWLPLHQLDPQTLRTIVNTFLEVFPETHSWLALYNVDSPAFALIGRAAPDSLAVDLERLEQTTRADAFAPVVLQDARDLFAGYMLDRDALSRFAGDAPTNTDFRPVVLFEAPKSGREHAGMENLQLLLPLRAGYPRHLVTSSDPDDFAAQTQAFSAALDHYLRAEMILVSEARPGEPMPEAALDAYIAAYETAPDFLPPRGRLRSQIGLLQQAGFEEEARALVERLEAVKSP